MIPDTNTVQQLGQTVAEVKTQLSPYVPALAVAAAWLGREIRNFNAACLRTAEYISGHGGILMMIRKLVWNPPGKCSVSSVQCSERIAALARSFLAVNRIH